MTEERTDAEAEAKAALVMTQVLVLALIEAGVVDGEVFRRIADDALTSAIDADPVDMTQTILRLNALIQDTYAAQPINTSLPEASGPVAGGEYPK